MRTGKACFLNLLVLIGMVAVATAQDLTPAPAAAGGSASVGIAAPSREAPTPSGPPDRMSWQAILKNGGWLMYVLAGMSVLTVALVAYFLAVLRAPQIAPRTFLREIIEKIRAGALDDARRLCEYKPCPLSAVTRAALDHMRNMPDGDLTLLKDVMEGEGGRQAESIQGQTQYLLDIAAVSPMIGLLGTVFGMLRAFSSVALNIANAKPVVLAAGVSQALITTAFGLMVGIPAMMFYAYFRRRASGLVATLEASSTDILTALMGTRA